MGRRAAHKKDQVGQGLAAHGEGCARLGPRWRLGLEGGESWGLNETVGRPINPSSQRYPKLARTGWAKRSRRGSITSASVPLSGDRQPAH